MTRIRQRRKCHAHCADDGRPCPNWAMNGQQVCASHGGITRHAKAAAARRVTEAKAVELYRAAAPVNGDGPAAPVDIVAAIDRLVGRVVQFEGYLASRVDEAREVELASAAGRERMHVELALYRQALAESRKLLVAVGHLGLDALRLEAETAQVRLERARGEAIVAAFDAAVDGLALPDAQRRQVLGRFAWELMHLPPEADTC